MEKKRRKFTAEFKAKAVELAQTMGSMRKAAEALGIGIPSLYDWKRAAEGEGPKESDPSLIEKLQNENKQLRKELKEQQQVVQVLKQTTVFFCQDRSTSRLC